jgi:putative DNA primase/helicase
MTDNHIHSGDIGISMSRVTAAEGSPPATLSNNEQKRQGPSVVLVRASEIVPESVRWIWPGIIAKGKVTGLAGHPVAASLASKTIVRSP